MSKYAPICRHLNIPESAWMGFVLHFLIVIPCLKEPHRPFSWREKNWYFYISWKYLICQGYKGFSICLHNSRICLNMSKYAPICRHLNIPESAWMGFVLHFLIVIPCLKEPHRPFSWREKNWYFYISWKYLICFLFLNIFASNISNPVLLFATEGNSRVFVVIYIKYIYTYI